MSSIFDIIEALEDAKIAFSLRITRDGAITLMADVPGQRWEIDVFQDGEIELEVFRSNGDIKGERELLEIIEEFRGLNYG